MPPVPQRADQIPERIETERLILRPLTMADVDGVWVYASDPEVTRFTIFDCHTNRRITEEWLKSAIESSAGESLLFGIEHREHSKIIGSCAIRAWDRQHNRAEMGWALARAYWNQGYATEAVRALIGFGFEHLKLNRLQALCVPAHIASRRVMEKAGMQFEGILRQAEFFKTAYQDVALHSILREEWKR
jgi:ribosomal-protein-alanine N-acetyltransferase